MAKMFTSGFRPRSTTKEAKKIIRNEMLSYFNPKDHRGAKTRLDAMKKDADSGNGGTYGKKYVSNYEKGKYLVDAGCCACYYSDQMKMLSKIYGKSNVNKWDGRKIHSTYSHLIAREYSAMLNERKRKK